MKRIFCCFICSILLLSFAGCNSAKNALVSGVYYAVDYTEVAPPYLQLDTNEHRFSFGASALMSYAERGTYIVMNGVIIARSQNATFKFEIKENNTLVLIDNGNLESLDIPVNTKFAMFEDSK